LSGARRWARSQAQQGKAGKSVLVGLSGRGDKDMPTLLRTVLAEKQVKQ
jgi:tryptophan synthase beta subunit